jgi:hypothetical protein
LARPDRSTNQSSMMTMHEEEYLGLSALNCRMASAADLVPPWAQQKIPLNMSTKMMKERNVEFFSCVGRTITEPLEVEFRQWQQKLNPSNDQLADRTRVDEMDLF